MKTLSLLEGNEEAVMFNDVSRKRRETLCVRFEKERSPRLLQSKTHSLCLKHMASLTDKRITLLYHV